MQAATCGKVVESSPFEHNRLSSIISEPDSITSRISVPVAVVLEKRQTQGKFWTTDTWHLENVLVGEHLALGSDSYGGVKTADTESGEQYLWSGFRVTLFRDACERYWHALIGDKPLVYVVCREDEADGGDEPALVTIDYDEALAHSETDAKVLSMDIPRELYQLMETFVLDNYKPAEFKKRKRKNWSKDDPRRG